MLANKIMGATSAAADINYIEDVFSTYLYTGNSSTQTITNGIDLAGKGGLVWFKRRDLGFPYQHELVDTARGINSWLISNSTNAAQPLSDLSSFNADGFSLDDDRGLANTSGASMASWTFRKQPKFFDVVTYTGDGAFGRTINHSLESIPGCVIIKRIDTSSQWLVWHQTDYFGAYYLNQTYAKGNWLASSAGITDTTMRVDGGAGPMPGGVTFDTNASGGTYVAYLFAHNAGGFGLSGNENVVSCGSFTGGSTVNLGYEPQWLLVKVTNSSGGWLLIDNMRGFLGTGNDTTTYLEPNTSSAESSIAFGVNVTPTGFTTTNLNPAGSFIYIAIRRGPMKVPTLANTVFSPIAVTASTGAAQTTGFPVDLQMQAWRDGAHNTRTSDRLRGVVTRPAEAYSRYINTDESVAEADNILGLTRYWTNTGFQTPSGNSGLPMVYWNFRRAPSFFDEVCFTDDGTGTQVVNHNLSVVPEMIIVKVRSNLQSWPVYITAGPKSLRLNTTEAAGSASLSPTATTFNAPGYPAGWTVVTYLFATCAGVSKVGSYTGTGTTQAINCGFTTGARFVLIKRTDSTGDWYVWDSARGIVAGDDPHLSLNTTAAEVTTDDSVDTDSAGFIVNQNAATNINVSGGSYIFLSVA